MVVVIDKNFELEMEALLEIDALIFFLFYDFLFNVPMLTRSNLYYMN